MKYSVELLKADIQDELDKMRRLEEEFEAVQKRLDLSRDQIPSYDRGAIGYLLHNFYNGCENIFRSISRFFENDLGPQSWHRDLLKRMQLEVPGYRPQVINEELYVILDDFRAFRHKFRHSYSFELDWEKERLVANKFWDATSMLRDQIAVFVKSLEHIERE